MIPEKQNIVQFKSLVKRLIYLFMTIIFLVIGLFLLVFFNSSITSWFQNSDSNLDSLYIDAKKKVMVQNETAKFWKPADLNLITDATLKQEVEYGKDLIAHTAKYLGPNGSVKQITNGMNCNNCHLDAGTKPWGNNYGSVYSMYPKMRARSGQVENLYKRVNDCMERSLNGQPLKEDEREMKAMIAYIEYIGSNVPKGKEANAAGIYDLEYLDRAANPVKGKALYNAKCASCHQINGEGILAADKKEYTYPPLWGKKSYNSGAGLFRISRFAGYIKYNMPLGATYENPQLSDEESWDIAAYVESLDRPSKDLSQDWPNISKKPVDHPFGPYSDKYTETQHKYGPFKAIKMEKKKMEEAEGKLKSKT
ncbi:c-type cytochrome [Flavobacterium granuli]|uniref:Thiosulfate dehydrogenase n=1 Tax=Flavobacterium granuli TaxID=280093 RepID=A0A1M5QBE6_9FLAO|nr:c-type cytochrome [Flavobacterium granuli]PRZ22146.1 thiosulfate dehydrogenase [Flavobacterium granuli]SHH11151.1 thiosulfate dehydrogenase [Flavobacterium granuli]